MSLIQRILSFLGLVDTAQTTVEEKGKAYHLKIIEQNIYTMVNTITFSTDMKKLFLIDDGRAIEFDLTKDNGILLGTLKGQITVATAFDFPKPDSDAPAGDTSGNISSSRSSAVAIKLETKDTVWSGVYHRARKVMSFVGATEIEIRTPGNTKYDYQPVLHFFKLGESILHIRRNRGDIFITALPRDIDKE
jgi:hypothetical protein